MSIREDQAGEPVRPVEGRRGRREERVTTVGVDRRLGSVELVVGHR